MEQAIQSVIITIGDELLIGQVTDTNSPFIAKELNSIGIDVYEMSSVHDDADHIMKSLDRAFDNADIIIVTGGLGPTKDDITKKTLCRYFNTELVSNDEVKKNIMQIYAHRQKVLNELTATQWLVPANAIILQNRIGSAPIMVFQHNQNKLLVSLPGVPMEMEVGMIEQVIPFIKTWLVKRNIHSVYIHHVNILVSGIPESALAILLSEWEEKLPSFLKLAYLPSNGKITLRLTAHYEKNAEEQYKKIMDEQIILLKKIIEPYFIKIENFL